MSSQISVIMSATQGPAGPAGAAGSAGPAGAQGEAGPAGPAGAFTDAGITSGTSMAYTAVLADRPEPLTAGYSFLIVPHVTNGVSPTISLSGGTAQPIWVKGASIPAGAMVANNPYALRSDGTRCHVEGQLNLSADEIVAKFTGTPDGTKFLRDDGTLAVGGSGSAGTVELESLKTSAYTTTNSDQFVPCSHASTPFTVTLHAATGSGQKLIIKNRGAAAVTVDGDSSDTIDGVPTVVLRQNEWVTVIDSGPGAWEEFSRSSRLVLEASRITTHQTNASTVIFNSITTNNGYFTESSGVFTCVSPGKFTFIAQIARVASVASNGVAIRKNSTVTQTSIPNPLSTTGPTMVIAATLNLAVGDTVDVQNYPSGTSSVAITESFLRVIRE